MLRSKDGSTSFHKGPQVKAGYPRGLKSMCFKIQDAMIDYAYGPKLNAFRFVVLAAQSCFQAAPADAPSLQPGASSVCSRSRACTTAGICAKVSMRA